MLLHLLAELRQTDSKEQCGCVPVAVTLATTVFPLQTCTEHAKLTATYIQDNNCYIHTIW